MVQKNSHIDHKVLVITGPTASGKSTAAVKTAMVIGGEIICADSMQIYSEMNIGTAYPEKADMEKVPHHLFGFVCPTSSFSVAQYVKMANDVIDDVLKRNKIPILCGGTGLYLSSVMKGIDYLDIPSDKSIRSELENEYDNLGSVSLYERLKTQDPKTSERLHPNDKKRIVRALEIKVLTGKTMTEISEESRAKGPKYTFMAYCLDHDRKVLYDRIEKRVDQMVKSGLINEAGALQHKYGDLSSTAGQAIGYKELFAYFNGECDLDSAILEIKKRTRNYAKRQLTWFRKMDDLIWLTDMNSDESSQKIIEDIK